MKIILPYYFHFLLFKIKFFSFMNLDTALFSFGITSLVIGITILTLYSSFGPGSENLIDPFEEDED
jgi:hypothetical protein